ncbi:D-2-hydroxyacid dehydrogenase [uncultured Ferrimonas sp.]|uniref:D-2-hydroxyacid dehydrogenase n=1 Tax=uncultured Ferrimonas sp. TaxID=432640 RepID=UPI0026170B3C|nr:D-2-hydroxyacid dehydrogenase [uncultured Ferrimonas sp.]
MIAILSARHFNRYQRLLAPHQIECSADPAAADVWLAEPALAAKALQQGHRPRWIASVYAGVDALLQSGIEADYQLTNVREVFGPLMTEYVFAQLLSRLRQLPRYAEAQQQQQWRPKGYGSLAQQTLVLVGTGNIGQCIAKAANAFGMTVIGVNTDGRDIDGFQRCYPSNQLHQALAQGDAVVSILPSTSATEKRFDASAFAAMKAEAGFINVGRGSAVDTNALTAALTEQRLAFAVLDVFEQEPLPSSSPLWHCPNLTITPHIAAASFPEQVASQFIDNLQRDRQGEPLWHLVDKQKGY